MPPRWVRVRVRFRVRVEHASSVVVVIPVTSVSAYVDAVVLVPFICDHVRFDEFVVAAVFVDSVLVQLLLVCSNAASQSSGPSPAGGTGLFVSQSRNHSSWSAWAAVVLSLTSTFKNPASAARPSGEM